MRKVKLYKLVNGMLRLVDYGVVNKISIYEGKGYTVEVVADDRQATWVAEKAEFKVLWNSLSAYHKRRLVAIPTADSSIRTKLVELKAEIAKINDYIMMAACHRRAVKRAVKRASFMASIANFLNTIFGTRRLCYA